MIVGLEHRRVSVLTPRKKTDFASSVRTGVFVSTLMRTNHQQAKAIEQLLDLLSLYRERQSKKT